MTSRAWLIVILVSTLCTVLALDHAYNEELKRTYAFVAEVILPTYCHPSSVGVKK